MFEENKVVMVALGTQHAVALASDGSGSPMPVLDEEIAGPAIVVEEEKQPAPAKIGSQKSAHSNKNKLLEVN